MAGCEYCILEAHSSGVTKICAISPNCPSVKSKFPKPKFESVSVRFSFVAVAEFMVG